MGVRHIFGRQRRNSRRGRLQLEALEQRNPLAAGLIPLDLIVPLDRTVEGFTVTGTAEAGAEIVIVDPSSPAETVISNPTAGGNGTLSGTFLGVPVEGTFSVNNETPSFQIGFQPPDQLTLSSSVAGTLSLLVGGTQQIPGSFTATLSGTFDTTTGNFTGTVQLTAKADGFEETLTVPVSVPNALQGLEFPDVTLASLADQVFFDANNDGIQNDGETGVEGVEISLQDAEGNLLESTTTNAEGFYSFYNLAPATYTLQVASLPDGFDLGKSNIGSDEAVDSDVNSRSGQSDPIALSVAQHVREIDVALRQTVAEWQNPNMIEDVTGNGEISALDALRIINFMDRNEGPVQLADDRPLGADFYDVTGNGEASGLDALRVINAMTRLAIEAESIDYAVAASLHDDDEAWPIDLDSAADSPAAQLF